MEDTFIDAQKDGWLKDDSLHGSSEDREIEEDNVLDCSELKLKRLVRRVNSQRTLVLKVKQLQHSNRFPKDLFLRSIHVLDSRIPKHVVTLDEKYLRHCLKLIHIRSSKGAPCNISMNMASMKMGILCDGMNPGNFRNDNACEFPSFVFDCPLAAETGSMTINSAGQWIVGSIMGSKSMMNILKNPLLRQYGAADGNANFGITSLDDVKGSPCYDFMNSPDGSSSYASQRLGKETPILGNQRYGSETAHKRLVSISSTNSTCSDQSSSSASAIITQGMLQVTWKSGLPHFVFSLDDHREVYVANLCKVEAADDKALDFMYLFHSRKGGQKEHEVRDNDLQIVGKMKVSTTFTVCPNNSGIMQREFVLFGGNGSFTDEMRTSSAKLRKSKGLSKKVVEALRISHSSKKRTTSRFGGSSAILENCSWEPCQDTGSNLDTLGGTSSLENYLPPNLELAAIVVKDHLPDNRQEKVGGWGLKFLKKVGVKQTIDGMEASIPSNCARDTGDCSTSMNVLVPAGPHGGPRIRNGGPSSLIERWRSGGHCDCGGWDLGCPLRILRTRTNSEEVLPQADTQGECKLIELFVQGSYHGAPALRMVNVHDGLYFIHFQSTLSVLQCFSIAVAFIHTQRPSLRPKNVQGLK